MLFGVLMGSLNYMAGTTTKGVSEKVMLMLGYNDHVGQDSDL